MTITKDEIDEANIYNKIARLETLVEQLEFRIAALEGTPVIPVIPDVDSAYENKCSICNIDFSYSMGYVCDNTACPMYPKTGDNFAPINTGG